MRTHRPRRGTRTLALAGGFVAVLAVGLFSPAAPPRAVETTAPDQSSALPSASDSPPAAPEPALHRVTTATAAAAVRLAYPGGCPASPIQPLPAACGVRPGGSPGVTSPTSGPPLRVLLCTWLN